MKNYQYTALTSRIKDCEVLIIHGVLHFEGEEEEDPEMEEPVNQGLTLIPSTCNDGWGRVKHHEIMTEEEWPMPNRLSLRYLTINEGRCYHIDTQLDTAQAEEMWERQEQEHPNDAFADYVVGTAPFGFLAIWLQGHSRSVLLQTFQAEEVPFNELETKAFSWIKETGEYEVISRQALEDNMRQFCYRYVPLEEYWNEQTGKWEEYADNDMYYDSIDIDSVEDLRTDGTFNYVEGDEEQLRYHTAGKPYRITVRWHAGRSKFLAHFWLREGVMTHIFNRFFSLFPDTRADILLRLDPRHQAYEIAFRPEGSRLALPIPMDCNQLIVFKDGEEHFKCPDYYLKPGQWSWFWHE